MKLVATLAAACIALTLPSSSLVAQSPRALTIEDYYKIKSVGDPQISPDGKWVAFTLTTRARPMAPTWHSPSGRAADAG